MAEIAIRLRTMNRDIDSWTDRTIDPKDQDHALLILTHWCRDETKRTGRKTDPHDYLIRVRTSPREGWRTYQP